jgi:hypothetical protein
MSQLINLKIKNMVCIVIISGPWPEADNIILNDLVHIPNKGDEFNFNLWHYRKQVEAIKKVVEITKQPCRVSGVTHTIYCNMQEIKIHLYCGEVKK